MLHLYRSLLFIILLLICDSALFNGVASKSASFTELSNIYFELWSAFVISLDGIDDYLVPMANA